MKYVKIKGLMAMASNTSNSKQLKEFLQAKKIFDKIKNQLMTLKFCQWV